MIDERRHIAAPVLDVTAIDDAIMIARGQQLLGIGHCRHIELAVAVVALAAQAVNIAIQRASVRSCRWRSI